MSQLQVTGEAKIRDLQGPVVANAGVITALDGAANQYVRGDGTLASFPTSGGGGSSVSYYLNGSVNQGTFAGSTYYEMGEDAITGTGTNFSTSTDGLLAQFITDAGVPDVTEIPSGNWNVEFFMGVSASSGALASFYVEIYKWDGSTFTLIATNAATPEFLTNTTTVDAYFTSVAMPTTTLAVTDRLAIRIYANVASKTVTLYTEDNRLCQVVTTFSKGMLSLNNLTDQSQYLTVGTAGTDFNIVSSGDTHTFNIPIASATNTGKLSSTDWNTFNNKQNALTNPITGSGASGRVAYYDGTTSITSEAAFNYDANTNRLGVNTNTPNATIGANAGTDSGYSLLLKNADTNYNGIGFGTDSTYGNLIATEKIGTALTRNLTLFNQGGYVSLTEAGNFGIGMINPNTGLDIYNGTNAYLWLHTATSGVTGTDGVRLALFNTNTANLRNFEGAFSITAEGNFSVITLGAENLRVESSTGKVGIGNPASVPEMLTVNGSIQQSSVTSALLKTDLNGKLIPAVAGSDYITPSAISGALNTVVKFTSPTQIGNSNITDDGSTITLGSKTFVANGNLGVGTSNPAVSGVGIDIYSATNTGLRFHNAASGTTVSDGAGINFSSGLNLGITNYEAGTIDIVTNGNSGVFIASNGYVGINGAVGGYPLDVSGSIKQTTVTSSMLKADASGVLVAAVAGTDYQAPLSNIVTGFSAANNVALWSGTTTLTGTSNLWYNSASNFLGIGTNNPQRRLTIFNATLDSQVQISGGAPSVALTDAVTGSIYQAKFAMATAAGHYVSGAVAGDFVLLSQTGATIFATSSTEKMRVNTSGRLLLGTTTDNGSLLQVAGSGTFANSVSSAGNATNSGIIVNNSNGATGTAQYYADFTASGGTVIGRILRGNGASGYEPNGLNIDNFAGMQIKLNTLGGSGGTFAVTGGAATFSNSVTAGQLIAGGGGSTGGVYAYLSTSVNGLPATSGTTQTAGALRLRGGDNAVLDFGLNSVNTWIQATDLSSLGTYYNLLLNPRGGNVGIGTSSPSTSLHVLTGNVQGLRVESSNSGYLEVGKTSGVRWRFANDYNVGNMLELLYNNSAGGTPIYTCMAFASSGNVLIGTTSDNGWKFQVNGEVTSKGSNSILFVQARDLSVYYGFYSDDSVSLKFYSTTGGVVGNFNRTSGVYTATSDINKKKDFEASNIGLNEILCLKPTLYRMKLDDANSPKQLGFIAQEVKEFIPQAYVESDDMIGLSDRPIIAALVKAVQEQQAQIEELKQLINNK